MEKILPSNFSMEETEADRYNWNSQGFLARVKEQVSHMSGNPLCDCSSSTATLGQKRFLQIFSVVVYIWGEMRKACT